LQHINDDGKLQGAAWPSPMAIDMYYAFEDPVNALGKDVQAAVNREIRQRWYTDAFKEYLQGGAEALRVFARKSPRPPMQITMTMPLNMSALAFPDESIWKQ
jgi:hypothetical protein